MYMFIEKHELGVMLACNFIYYLLVGHRGERRQHSLLYGTWQCCGSWIPATSVRCGMLGEPLFRKWAAYFVKMILDYGLSQDLMHSCICKCFKSVSGSYLESKEWWSLDKVTAFPGQWHLTKLHKTQRRKGEILGGRKKREKVSGKGQTNFQNRNGCPSATDTVF